MSSSPFAVAGFCETGSRIVSFGAAGPKLRTFPDALTNAGAGGERRSVSDTCPGREMAGDWSSALRFLGISDCSITSAKLGDRRIRHTLPSPWSGAALIRLVGRPTHCGFSDSRSRTGVTRLVTLSPSPVGCTKPSIGLSTAKTEHTSADPSTERRPGALSPLLVRLTRMLAPPNLFPSPAQRQRWHPIESSTSC